MNGDMRKLTFVTVLSLIFVQGAFAQTSVERLQNEQAQDERLELSQDAIERFREKTAKVRQVMQERREQSREAFQEKQASARERVRQERERLRQKLQVIKDERKKQITERVHTNLNELNARLTNHYLNILDQLDGVLHNISTRIEKADAHGLDVTSARNTVSAAAQAIENARNAVEVQAGATYTFEVVNEARLRPNVGTARQELHADLVAVREKVFAARDALRETATVLAQIPQVDELEVPGVESGGLEP